MNKLSLSKLKNLKPGTKVIYKAKLYSEMLVFLDYSSESITFKNQKGYLWSLSIYDVRLFEFYKKSTKFDLIS